MIWLTFTVPLAVAVIAVHADHIPGLRILVDGTPSGPPPYTDRTETADEWLRELPAVDHTYRTTQAACRAYERKEAS